MAKILGIKILNENEELGAKTESFEILVVTAVKFHALDIKYQMEYQLHLFVIHACEDTGKLALLTNWDEAELLGSKDMENDLIAKFNLQITSGEADACIKNIATTLVLDRLPGCGIKVMGKLVPVFSDAASISNHYIFNLLLK